MTDQLLSGITAGIISLLVSGIAYLASERKARGELRNAERNIATKFAEELMRHRLRLYPGAFVATTRVGKGDVNDPQTVIAHGEQLASLRAWKVGEVECVISVYAEECFAELVEALKRNPGDGDTYAARQLEKLYHARQKFRGALRRDLGLMHSSSIQLQAELPHAPPPWEQRGKNPPRRA